MTVRMSLIIQFVVPSKFPIVWCSSMSPGWLKISLSIILYFSLVLPSGVIYPPDDSAVCYLLRVWSPSLEYFWLNAAVFSFAELNFGWINHFFPFDLKLYFFLATDTLFVNSFNIIDTRSTRLRKNPSLRGIISLCNWLLLTTEGFVSSWTDSE